ncbi:hypothetical protein [Dysosmobacter sp.]|uniref:hypothetical protein n=1 Tax=Dysosmobacter sp. TaxID=2591382 RepID=UPI002A85A92E|nr:hypothetical protein [Dysosmobacter sp.]MDY3985551.1 hypothetical protein [Dysosmobacter sp.]
MAAEVPDRCSIPPGERKVFSQSNAWFVLFNGGAGMAGLKDPPGAAVVEKIRLSVKKTNTNGGRFCYTVFESRKIAPYFRIEKGRGRKRGKRLSWTEPLKNIRRNHRGFCEERRYQKK